MKNKNLDNQNKVGDKQKFGNFSTSDTSHSSPEASLQPPATRHMSLAKRFLREPLVHFFVLGLAVFGLHAALDQKPEASVNNPHLVEISSADLDWMRTIFTKRMGRGPTVEELRGQVHQLIREQILSREAVAMGLDEEDIVVRRRLAQKMEFLFKDLSSMTEPTEADLRAFYTENQQKYEIPPRFTFTQVYFSVDKRGAEGAAQAAQAIIRNQAEPKRAATLGDTSMLSAGCTLCSEMEIRNQFGTEFAGTVKKIDPGTWHGPVRSAYGVHAVYIHERQGAEIPKFEEVVDRVESDWMLAQQEENTRKVYGEVRSRYRVLLEGLPYELDVSD